MTNREFLNAIIKANISEDLALFAQEQIEKLDAKNEKRKTSFSPKQKENEELKIQILDLLPKEGLFASEVGELLNISTSKANALLGQLEESGQIVSTVEKTPKKNKAKHYTRVVPVVDLGSYEIISEMNIDEMIEKG